jgi:hypothetical protein
MGSNIFARLLFQAGLCFAERLNPLWKGWDKGLDLLQIEFEAPP